MLYTDTLANLGGLLLGLCAIPQAYRAWRTKSAHDVSWWFLAMWFFGDLALLLFGIETGLPIAIVLNNAFNALCIIVISWYK